MNTQFDKNKFNSAMSTIARINLENRIQEACNLWNELTSPSKLRTDAEHNRCAKHAKAIRRIIQNSGIPVKELSNGALYVERPINEVTIFGVNYDGALND